LNDHPSEHFVLSFRTVHFYYQNVCHPVIYTHKSDNPGIFIVPAFQFQVTAGEKTFG